MQLQKKLKEINKIKKFLGISKNELILLEVYKQYGREFDNQEEAIRFLKEECHEFKKFGRKS